MKIVIIDDTKENLDAAKKAADSYPKHQFVFVDNATEAVGLIPKVDGIVSDLFFLEEELNSENDLTRLYETYCSKIIPGVTFDEVIKDYYCWDIERGNIKLEQVTDLVKTGSMKAPIEGLIKFYEKAKNIDEVSKLRKQMKNLPPSQFPYGGALTLLAKRLGKKHCLVSNIHRHADIISSHENSFDGVILMLPLLEEKVLTLRECTSDGSGCLTFMGSDEICNYSDVFSTAPPEEEYKVTLARIKEDPQVWIESIRRVLAQK